MYCHHCGAKILDGAKYCAECGSKVEVEPHSFIVNTDYSKETKGYSWPHSNTSPSKKLPIFNTPSSKSKTKKPFYKRVWFWIVVVLFAFALFGNSGENNKSGGGLTEQVHSTEKPSPQQTAKPTETPKPTPTPVPVYSIGETASFGDLEVTVNSYTFSQYSGALNGLNKATDGLLYCVVYVDVKNTSSSAIDLQNSFATNYNFTLVSDGENKYNTSWSHYSDFLFGNNSIPSQGTLKNKCLSFSVPEELKDNNLSLVMQLSYNSIWKDERVQWVLR